MGFMFKKKKQPMTYYDVLLTLDSIVHNANH